MPGQLQLLGEKIDQRCVRSSFDCRLAEVDLYCAAVVAHNNVVLGVWNNVNGENCHWAELSSTDVNLLDGFSCGVPSCAFMKPRHFYLVLCVLGFVLPYSQFVPWLLERGLNVTL